MSFRSCSVQSMSGILENPHQQVPQVDLSDSVNPAFVQHRTDFFSFRVDVAMSFCRALPS